MKPPYALHHGNNIKVLSGYADNTFDSIVTDSPYALAFMGMKWDDFKDGETRALGKDEKSAANLNFQRWTERWARAAFRVLKPGGYLVCFGAPRTYHRMASGIEDAGFEIRDQISWVFSTGFPKSMDASKAIDKSVKVKRKVVGQRKHPTLKDNSKVKRTSSHQFHGSNTLLDEWLITEPGSEMAKEWDGWGTALKPAHEPILIARKPLDGTIAQNLMKWGTGAINITASRVAGESWKFGTQTKFNGGNYGTNKPSNGNVHATNVSGGLEGRFPANLIHDGSPEVVKLFPESRGQVSNLSNHSKAKISPNGIFGNFGPANDHKARKDKGSAARFFKHVSFDSELDDFPRIIYAPKPSRKERNEGLKHFSNSHPTVKPISLMQYLVKMVTRVGGLCLDLFTGSGTTGCACMLEGIRFVGIDDDSGSIMIAEERIKFAFKKSRVHGKQMQLTT